MRANIGGARSTALPYSSTGYDPALADRSVSIQQILFDRRFWHIVRTLWSLTMLNRDDESVSVHDQEWSNHLRLRAARLTSTLVELGATFIKLGQFLSVRRDFLPVEVAEELALLQDRVPPFSQDKVRQTVESELGLNLEDIFASFDLIPLASASIGQVHKATLKDGRVVAVKVQRPDLAPQLYQDLGAMRWFSKVGKLARLKGDWDGWLEMADQFGRVLFNEIDYLKEGRNADRLRYALRSRNDVLIPRVFWKQTSRRVLTLEFLPGTKIDDAHALAEAQISTVDLAKKLIDCYMDQVLMHGLFHADPHAGNLAVNSQGLLIIYDFGVIGEISENQREEIFQAIQAIVTRNTGKLVQSLSALGIVRKTSNLAAIERALSPFIDYYAGKTVADLDFSHLEKDIDQIVMDRALRLPADMAYLIRTNVILEGIARTLEPDFSFVEAAKPSLNRWLFDEKMRKGFNIGGIIKAISRASVSSSENSNQQQKIMPETENLAFQVTKVTRLESELKTAKQKAKSIATLAISQLLLNLWGWQPYFAAKNHLDGNYFLIGNGLMGAIILWQVLKPTRLIKP